MQNSNTQINELGVREICTRINQLLHHGEYLKHEQELVQLYKALENKDQKPRRSDWWNIRMLIPDGIENTYSRLQPIEGLTAIYAGIKADKLGSPDDDKSVFIDATDSMPTIALGDFMISKFSDSQTVCKKFFPNVESFSFLIKCSHTESETTDTTATALMMTARTETAEKLLEIDKIRLQLSDMIDKYSTPLREIAQGHLESHADSEPEESDEEAELDTNPKRRKTYDELGTSKDTDQQRVCVDEYLKPAKGVANMRVGFIKGDSYEPHLIDFFGAMQCDRWYFSKRLPCPLAPTFSNGAKFKDTETTSPPEFNLENPGGYANRDTVVTQKMLDDAPQLVSVYENMHELAYKLQKQIREVAHYVRAEFKFVVRVVKEDGVQIDYAVNDLSLMQKIAIGKLYLSAISVRMQSKDESEGEEDSSEEDSDDDEEYCGDEEEEEDEDDEEDDEDDEDYDEEEEEDDDED